MGTRSGNLDRKVEIYELTEHLGDDGNAQVDINGNPISISQDGVPSNSLTNKVDAWAGVKPMRGKERAQYGRDRSADQVYNFMLRFDKEILTTDKIKFNGQFWDIVSISPMGRRFREIMEVEAELLDVKYVVKE